MMARPSSSKYNWQKPPIFVYEDNYGYGMNFYKPMIDYIDGKNKGRAVKAPHLPWSNERGLDRYSSRNLVQSYSETDLSRIARRTEAHMKSALRDFKKTTKSCFQLSKSVSASKITESVKLEKEKRHKRELFRQVKVLKSRMADALDYSPDLDKRVEKELRGMQKDLRGKSASAIEARLLSKSRKNIAENVDMDLCTASSHCSIAGRTRVRFIDKRVDESINEAISQPLVQLSSDLRGFHRKTAEIFCEKR